MTARPPASDPTAPRLLLLGRPELTDATPPVAFVPERRFQLLAVLAMQSGQWVARDRLAALLWPERPNAEARRNLRHVVFKARDIAAALQASDHALCWDVATDLRAFESLLAAEQTALAVALRRGMLLDGLDDAANPAFSEWLAAERLRFDERWRQAALGALAAAAPAERAELARRVRAVDPLDEDALEAQLRAEIEQGHPARAWQLYRDYAHSLAEALGVEPSHRLRDLLQREAPAGPANESRAPATGAVAATPSSPATPEAAAAFVGRRGELAELMRLLAREDVRAVTVLGPGGIGKSSLARRALHAAADAFAGGRVWVELQDLSDLPAVLARVADQLGVPIDDAQDPVAQIGRRLGPERVLCVLDNAEHLLPELPSLLERLLAAAPALSLLVTSRVRLGHAGEHSLPLAGLAVPDEDSRDLEAAVAFDAVRLFEARATVAQRSFSLARHLGAVIDIVASVGGLPLAIELAAGWVRLLPAEEIALDLRRSLDLLERDPATPGTPARPEHDSARAVLERSWSLLAPREREALAALTVFQGGFTRAAALAVARAPLPLLSSLVDKSLLAADDAGRFGLHPLVAAFAAERLAHDGARADELARRHAAHYARSIWPNWPPAPAPTIGRWSKGSRRSTRIAARPGVMAWPSAPPNGSPRRAAPGATTSRCEAAPARASRISRARWNSARTGRAGSRWRPTCAPRCRACTICVASTRRALPSPPRVPNWPSSAATGVRCTAASPTPAAAIRHRRSGAPPALASSARWRSAATTAWRSKSRPR
ncbi:MAG: BTAD domain-containing putative transcriptional regulator [Rubrivivax sp.]